MYDNGEGFMFLVIKKNILRVIGLIFCFTNVVYAQNDVNLTEKELTRESVLPLIENVQSVRNRNVSKAGTFSIYSLGGIVVNNPFFTNIAIGGTLGYHFNEFHSINLFGAYMFSSPTKYANQIIEDPTLTSGNNEYLKDFKSFPQAKILALGIYEFSPLYGKMSFTKNMVLNIDLLFSVGAGTIIFETSSPLPAFTVGLGQRFYFGKNWGLRFDLIGLMYFGPNYTAGPFNRQEEYILDHFDRQFTFHFLASAGLVFLL